MSTKINYFGGGYRHGSKTIAGRSLNLGKIDETRSDIHTNTAGNTN